MKIHKFTFLLTFFGILAIQCEAVVFLQPSEISQFSSSLPSQHEFCLRTNTWEPPQIVLTNVASANLPVWIANAGDGSDRLFIVQQSGTVIIVGKNTPFLDLRTNIAVVTPINSPPSNPQTKMVSIAFPPDYHHKGYFYVSYFTWDGTFRVSRFYTSTNNPDLADPGSEQIIGSNYSLGCGNAGQLVFAPDGTLYLNLAGPIANARNLDLLSGKMLALLNEEGRPLTATLQTYWPFSQFFSQTDCAIIGGAFAEDRCCRMNGVYFYGDANGVIWGLKETGTNWIKYNLASPTVGIWLPTDPLPGSNPPVNPNPGQGLTNGFPTLPTNGSPIVATGPITLATTGGISLPSNSDATPKIATSISANKPATSANIPQTPMTVQTTNSVPQHPFTISAFGQDEKGRLYVANYGASYLTQGGPPNYTPVENYAGGGIYLIQDNLLQFTVHEINEGNHVTLEWQSAPGIRYHIQKTLDLQRWIDVRPEMTGNGDVLSAFDLPLNSRIFYRVIAIPVATAD